jgi:8-oxo-dGTP pyrophosphatase MutT (NUDIX family)
MSSPKPLVEGVDYYVDPEGLWVFTAAFLKRRGFCCHQGCRHCPYENASETRERASALCIHEGRLLIVRMTEPESGETRAYPPGGKIEPGESPAQTAARETFEETGYRVRAVPSSVTTRRYPYRWGGKDYDVTTHFVRAFLLSPELSPEPRSAQGVDGLVSVEWIALSEVAAVFAKDGALGPVLADVLGSED